MRLFDTVTPDFVVTVSRLTNYLSRRLAADRKLRRLGVSGEISGLSVQANGTLYFDLKDRDALIKCVAWSEAAGGFPPLANGQAVVAIGNVGVFSKKSTYQLTVFAVELEGAGRLHAVYEALKRRLDAEGLFDPDRKRDLPAFPFHVGLVSSRTANGAGDFLTQAAQLAPHVRITLFETPVQGVSAAPEIVKAIDRASRAAVDLVVVARGGGSYEDLFVFNDERIVRALARCAHPTVSAIGHTVDTPLTDFVADRHAATPSTAAQEFLPRRADLLRSIAIAVRQLDRAAERALERVRRDLQRIEVRSPLANPERLLLERRQAVDSAATDLGGIAAGLMRTRVAAFGALKMRLEAANPSVRLSRRRERLARVSSDLARSIGVRLRAQTELLASLGLRLAARTPSARLSRGREQLVLAHFALKTAAREAQARQRRRLAAIAGRLAPAALAGNARRATRLQLVAAMLDGRDPTRILQRGYAIVSVNGGILRDAQRVAPGMLVTAQLARGTLAARVESTVGDGGE